jgi:hypothetical protein
MFIPDSDPTIFVIPDPGSRIPDPDPGSGSRILFKKEMCKISLIFFSPDQMITIVNDHTKFNFSSFIYFSSPGINLIIYQFHYFIQASVLRNLPVLLIKNV